MSKKLIIVLLSVCYVGCASAQLRDPTHIEKREKKFNAPFEKVWDAVIDSFTDDNRPIITIEKSSGIIITDVVRISRSTLIKYAHVPYGLLTTGYTDGRYKLNLRVKKINDNITVAKINAHIEGYYGLTIAEDRDWYVLESRGVLENEILNNLTVRFKLLESSTKDPRFEKPPHEETLSKKTAAVEIPKEKTSLKKQVLPNLADRYGKYEVLYQKGNVQIIKKDVFLSDEIFVLVRGKEIAGPYWYRENKHFGLSKKALTPLLGNYKVINKTERVEIIKEIKPLRVDLVYILVDDRVVTGPHQHP